LGNDFIIVDARGRNFPAARAGRIAATWCDRHFGIGADGLALVLPSRVALFRMRILNADGSEAEMCGNAIRCFAKYVFERGLTQEKEFGVETLAGIIRPHLRVRNGRVHAIKVDMGEPRLRRSQIPMQGPDLSTVVRERLRVLGKPLEITCVSMGNPHCVTFVDDVEQAPVARIGPAVEHHAAFPQRTNVEFVEVCGPTELRMRVWERGVGETLACGTGACASVVAAVLAGRAGRKATVHLTGGDLRIEWRERDNHVYLEGPATEVFSGEIALP
jgi:diaminopimelate epimerase